MLWSKSGSAHVHWFLVHCSATIHVIMSTVYENTIWIQLRGRIQQVFLWNADNITHIRAKQWLETIPHMIGYLGFWWKSCLHRNWRNSVRSENFSPPLSILHTSRVHTSHVFNARDYWYVQLSPFRTQDRKARRWRTGVDRNSTLGFEWTTFMNGIDLFIASYCYQWTKLHNRQTYLNCANAQKWNKKSTTLS